MVITIVGFSGMFLILLAFLMEQLGKWKNNYFVYDVVNFVGAGLMIVYAYAISSWPFLFLNLIWAVYSLRDSVVDLIVLGKKVKVRRKKKKMK